MASAKQRYECCPRQYQNGGDTLMCVACKKKYHYSCVNFTKQTFKELAPEWKSSWQCPACRNRQPKCDNSNTPVRVSVHSDSDPPLTTAAPTLNDMREIIREEVQTMLNNLKADMLAIFYDKIKEVQSEVAEIKKSIDNQYEDMTAYVSSAMQSFKEEFTATTDFISAEQRDLNQQIKERDTVIKNLQSSEIKLQSELSNLEERLRTVEKISRSTNFEIQAVPERKNENVTSLVKSLFETMSLSIESEKVSFCRRTAKSNKTSNRPRNILVTMTTPFLRDQILSAAHRYNKINTKNPLNSGHLGVSGETNRIYLSEHLAPQTKALHAAVRHEAKKKGYKFVWIKYGRIFVRKDETSNPIHINNNNALSKLK